MKKIIFILFCLILQQSLLAQTVTVQAPSHVACGENFRLSYVINTQEVESFRAGDIPEGLDVITGPYTSRSSSFQMINGHTSSSSSITYTYTLYAAKNGTYVVPAAKAVIDGKTVLSNSVRITVSGSAPKANRQGAPRMHGYNDEDNMQAAGSAISGSDLFIRVSANKKRVHEQEPILLTYKVYTQVDLTQLEGKMPDLTGFHTQEIPLPRQKSFAVETINGRPYRTVTWSQYVMYPQMTGNLKIPSITFKGIIVQRNKNVDPFEAFFNGGSAYIEVKRNVSAPAVTIQVDPLPTRPTGFSGGVGSFHISASADKTEVKAGEPVTVRVIVDGIGNLKLLKQPVLSLPKDFDKYDPKITDKTKLTRNGVEGSMVYDFLIVPRNQGKYTIPSIDFIYYDTTTNGYKTLKTREIALNVLKGSGKSTVADFTSNKDNDIHDIKTGNVSLLKKGNYLYGSFRYLCWLLIPLILFIVCTIIFRKRAIDNANIVRMRGKKANKVATKRLRFASKLMQKGKHNEFYDEVLRALWGYVGDKLNIPVEKLSRENIKEKFNSNNIADTIVNSFIEAIDECEYARFAPGDPKGKMDVVYDKAVKAITDIDDMLNTNKTSKSHIKIFVLLLMLFPCVTANSAVTKQMADAEYAKGNYQLAIKQYNDLLKKGVSADIYYNLGNAYFRTDNITQAVLAYERAYKMSPGDRDIRFNLQFARSKTIDKITPQPEMFFVTWYKSLVNFTDSNTWAVISIVMFILALLMFSLYLFGPSTVFIRGGFYIGTLCIILFAATLFLSWQQKLQAENHSGAIIIAPTVVVKNTPSLTSGNNMILHEGTRVDITDRSIKGWLGVRLTDGREGWLHSKEIEEI
jgi:tetratricopeptide (TPR) repeat protein